MPLTKHLQNRHYAVLEAPSTLGLRSEGVDRLPEVLLEQGLAERLSARHAGCIKPDSRSSQRDLETNVLNGKDIASYSYKLADAMGALLDAGDFPVVLGGDCSIVLGSALALKRRGRYGLLFVDGQADFFQPEAEPYGEAASMDLALVTGHGPTLLTHFDGDSPLIRPMDAVAFGYRDHEDQAQFGSQPLPSELRAFDLPAIQRLGVGRAAEEAVRHLSRGDLDGFWIHVDADCLDDAVMPAVDFRLAGGLSPDHLETVLKTALDSGRAVGIEVTIYNPALDPDGRAGKLLTDLLVSALSGDTARA
ncbi:arginase [Steroidobacter agaridevorans]|uniref:Arginase n=1 Tax=Steroidobacter agaridevorans TaxID=2695856 RepID=A0A829YCW2_9GAMM|nr:arginase family protein [Steroidobacter agaridevorans]GFE81109.1 arginase [Steroidobacter agaridevorans]